ncbi:MAG: type II secretion system minor pseudopilin GspH [Gammaproteobacteria bacterium]|nr:type II secretion system minor pseudopilin GspH [Gammaproteobacteria bacterium]
MPTSGIGISADRVRSLRWAVRGFSLLELLVVVAIIGIFLGVAVLSTDLAAFDRKMDQEARRLSNLLQLVSDEALMQSRDYGVLFTEDGYRFYYYDYAELAWLLPTDDRLLAPYRLPDDMIFEVSIDDRDVLLEPELDADSDDPPEPQVLIFSSGEMTPFVASFVRESDVTEDRILLSSEFDGTMEISREAF